MAVLTVTAITGAHPYADKFPMLGDAELAELAESIKSNGLRNPIVVTPEGLILDGRNRYAACQQIGIDPLVVVYDGEDLAEYVIDCNSSRRHMSTGARAMATALVLAADGRRNDGRWKRGSVDIGESPNIETWRDSLKRCGVILDHAPDLAEPVVSGTLPLDAAYKKAVEIRDAERQKLEEQERLDAEEADAQRFIEDRAPDLAARVDGTDLQTYAEALALWERRNREEAQRIAAEKAKEEREQREYDQTMTDLYTGIAKALDTLGGYGGRDSLDKLMAAYSPKYLNPVQYARVYEPENVRNVGKFAHMLLDWMEANQ